MYSSSSPVVRVSAFANVANHPLVRCWWMLVPVLIFCQDENCNPLAFEYGQNMLEHIPTLSIHFQHVYHVLTFKQTSPKHRWPSGQRASVCLWQNEHQEPYCCLYELCCYVIFAFLYDSCMYERYERTYMKQVEIACISMLTSGQIMSFTWRISDSFLGIDAGAAVEVEDS